MTELIPMEENDGQQQEQDVAEREERLVDVLKELYWLFHVDRIKDYTDIRSKDIDFIATCCGVADYRKPKL